MKWQKRGELARGRLLRSTSELLHRQGYSSTGLSEILAHSGTPKGSLYFYFPGGKEELVTAALEQSSDELTKLLEGMLAGAPTIVAAIHGVIEFFSGQLERSRFEKGCPIATVALEEAARSDSLHGVCAATYRRWHLLVQQRLEREGFAPARADSLANLMLTTLEGALLVSRAHRSTEPLARAGRELVRIVEREGDRA
jgi:TetR/AcrR family transcriptional repressor of lmrAB and yxaGH operons